jgi:hypothetical protein
MSCCDQYLRPNILVDWVALPLRIQGFLGSITGQEVGYPDSFRGIHNRQVLRQHLKADNVHFLPHVSHFIIHSHPIGAVQPVLFRSVNVYIDVIIATGWTAGARFPTGAKDFSLLHSVQAGSGAHPISYTLGTGGTFPGSTAAGVEADHSPSSSAEIKIDGAIDPLPNTSSWRGA